MQQGKNFQFIDFDNKKEVYQNLKRGDIKMPKHYDNPQAILRLRRETELLRQSAERSPFTGILTIFCYTLWKDYKYSQMKVSDFCGKIIEFNEKYENEPFTELQNRLMNFADWTIEYQVFTESDFPRYKSKIAQDYIREQVRCNNLINELSTRYILYGMTILMESGFQKKKLTNFKEKFNKYIEIISDDSNKMSVMDLHRELADNIGIYIEKPIFE